MNMDQITFLNDLEKHLQARKIADVDGIVDEYREHFRFKLADGYPEAEIAARLGAPQEIASQYTPAEAGLPKDRNGLKTLTAIGLSFLFLFALAIIISFLSWVIVVGATAVASAVLGIALIGGFNPAGLIPFIPRAGSIMMGISSLGLALFAGTGTIYCWRYSLQWIKAYFHWNHRCLAIAAGRPASPPIAAIPQFQPRTRRWLRRLTGLALAVFGIGFVLSYAVLALTAGNFEFWHVWGWFVS